MDDIPPFIKECSRSRLRTARIHQFVLDLSTDNHMIEQYELAVLIARKIKLSNEYQNDISVRLIFNWILQVLEQMENVLYERNIIWFYHA